MGFKPSISCSSITKLIKQEQMYIHVIMHDLPHCITASMHQYMFMAFKQIKTLISIKEIKQNKAKQNKVNRYM